jgi:hypothetical protein
MLNVSNTVQQTRQTVSHRRTGYSLETRIAVWDAVNAYIDAGPVGSVDAVEVASEFYNTRASLETQAEITHEAFVFHVESKIKLMEGR